MAFDDSIFDCYHSLPLMLQLLLPMSSSYFIGPSPETFGQARIYCTDQSSTLASFHNRSDFILLQQLCQSTNDNCWIGLSDRGIEGGYVFIDGTNGSYGFNIDGSPTTGISPWAAFHPHGSNMTNCVQISKDNNYLLDDDTCATKKTPICNDVPTIDPTYYPSSTPSLSSPPTSEPSTYPSHEPTLIPTPFDQTIFLDVSLPTSTTSNQPYIINNTNKLTSTTLNKKADAAITDTDNNSIFNLDWLSIDILVVIGCILIFGVFASCILLIFLCIYRQRNQKKKKQRARKQKQKQKQEAIAKNIELVNNSKSLRKQSDAKQNEDLLDIQLSVASIIGVIETNDSIQSEDMNETQIHEEEFKNENYNNKQQSVEDMYRKGSTGNGIHGEIGECKPYHHDHQSPNSWNGKDIKIPEQTVTMPQSYPPPYKHPSSNQPMASFNTFKNLKKLKLVPVPSQSMMISQAEDGGGHSPRSPSVLSAYV